MTQWRHVTCTARLSVCYNLEVWEKNGIWKRKKNKNFTEHHCHCHWWAAMKRGRIKGKWGDGPWQWNLTLQRRWRTKSSRAPSSSISFFLLCCLLSTHPGLWSRPPTSCPNFDMSQLLTFVTLHAYCINKFATLTAFHRSFIEKPKLKVIITDIKSSLLRSGDLWVKAAKHLASLMHYDMIWTYNKLSWDKALDHRIMQDDLNYNNKKYSD